MSLFRQKLEEIHNKHIRPEFLELEKRGNITLEEWKNLSCNSYEREILVPHFTDEALAHAVQHTLSNVQPGARPYSTYDQAMCGLYGPELLKRFQRAIVALADAEITYQLCREIFETLLPVLPEREKMVVQEMLKEI